MIHLKRAYDTAGKADGLRILVERLWPRGVSKEVAKLDLWLKEIAPSAELRTWFHHDPERWPDFRKKYTAELKAQPGVLKLLKLLSDREDVTFVYAAHDEEHNSAVVLRDALGKL